VFGSLVLSGSLVGDQSVSFVVRGPSFVVVLLRVVC